MSQQAGKTNAPKLVLLSDVKEQKIKRGLSFRRCGQIRWGWAPLPDFGKPCSLPCCRYPALGASASARTQCRCSGWSFCSFQIAPTLCGKRESGQRRLIILPTKRIWNRFGLWIFRDTCSVILGMSSIPTTLAQTEISQQLVDGLYWLWWSLTFP